MRIYTASLCGLVSRRLYRQQRFKQRLEQLEVEGVGPVGLGIRWVIVDFDEEAVDAGGYGGTREQRNEFRLAAAGAVGCRGLLHGVGGIEDDGREVAHDGERAEIDYEVVVAEGGTALGKEYAFVAGGADFFDAVAHVPRGDKLAFLDVDGAAGFAGGNEQIGLTAKECGNLEDVDGLRGDFTLRGLVHVGKDRQAGRAGDAAEDAGAFNEAGTAKALDAGAIGFVVAGFEDEGDVEVGGYALDGFGEGKGVVLGLDDAGAGDEKEAARADVHRPDFKGRAHDTNSIVLRWLFPLARVRRRIELASQVPKCEGPGAPGLEGLPR